MVKQINALATLVVFASVYWRKANNYRSAENYGSSKEIDEIRNSLAERQWVDSYPVPVTMITESELAECLAERQTQWEALKGATTADAAVERQVFEVLFTDNGKLIKPQYSGNAGFRRASVYFSAMVQRFRSGEQLSGQVPVFIRSYADESDRIIDQQMENELRNVGTVEVPALDKLKAAKRLFDLGCREIRVRKLYPSSTAQKLYGLCQLDLDWPQLNIMKRLYLPADVKEYIPIGRLRHEDLVKLNNRFEADQLRKAGKPLSDRQKAMEPLAEQEVRDYLDNQRKPGEGNAEKIMNRKDIEQGSKSNRVDFFKIALQAVMDNKVTPMVPYIDHADALNLHKALIDAGKAGTAAIAVQLAQSQPALVSAVKDVTTANKTDAAVSALTAVLNPPPAPSSEEVALTNLVNDCLKAGKAGAATAALMAVLNPPAPVNTGNGDRDRGNVKATVAVAKK